MPVTYGIHADSGYLRITGSGETTTQEWRDVIEAVAKDPGFATALNLLVDVRDHRSVVSSELFWHLTREVVTERARNTRWAVLVARVVSEGMANMLSALVDKAGVSVKVFRDAAEAEAWVTKS